MGQEGLKVRLDQLAQIGWAGIIFFSFCAVMAARDHQYGPAAGLAAFIPLGMAVLLSAGHLIFTADGVELRSPIGRYRIAWQEVTGTEFGPGGTMILRGADKRFMVMPISMWSGPDVVAAARLLQAQTEGRGFTPRRNLLADYMIHHNTRV